jgi:hypothetical protein
VPTFERRAAVLRLLGALLGQTLPAPAFEVVVADDNTFKMVPTSGAVPRAGDRPAGATLARGRLQRGDPQRGRRGPRCPARRHAAAPSCLQQHAGAHPPGSRRCIVGAALMTERPDTAHPGPASASSTRTSSSWSEPVDR